MIDQYPPVSSQNQLEFKNDVTNINEAGKLLKEKIKHDKDDEDLRKYRKLDPDLASLGNRLSDLAKFKKLETDPNNLENKLSELVKFKKLIKDLATLETILQQAAAVNVFPSEKRANIPGIDTYTVYLTYAQYNFTIDCAGKAPYAGTLKPNERPNKAMIIQRDPNTFDSWTIQSRAKKEYLHCDPAATPTFKWAATAAGNKCHFAFDAIKKPAGGFHLRALSSGLIWIPHQEENDAGNLALEPFNTEWANADQGTGTWVMQLCTLP